MKVFWLFNHPAPYKINLFNELGKHVDLTAMFIRDQEADKKASFYNAEAKNFKAIYCHASPKGEYGSNDNAPRDHLKNNHYDVVVLNGYRSFTQAKVISYCKKHKIPYIFYINGGIAPGRENPIKKAIKTHYIKGASAYLCPDERSKKYLIHYGAPSESISLYPYSTVFEEKVLERPLSKEKKMELRKQFGLSEGILYASCGYFIERKNFLGLLDVYAKLKKESSLILIGGGEQQKAIEEKIKERNLTNVKILPFMEHNRLLQVFSCCDALLFLSKEDIYGHVVEEAFSQGLPVMSSDRVNGALHLIEDGIDGRIVSLDDEEGILKAMEDILNPAFPEKALLKARENTIEATARHHIRYFEEYLKKIKS